MVPAKFLTFGEVLQPAKSVQTDMFLVVQTAGFLLLLQSSCYLLKGGDPAITKKI